MWVYRNANSMWERKGKRVMCGSCHIHVQMYASFENYATIYLNNDDDGDGDDDDDDGGVGDGDGDGDDIDINVYIYIDNVI